jgi:hypothetical protein
VTYLTLAAAANRLHLQADSAKCSAIPTSVTTDVKYGRDGFMPSFFMKAPAPNAKMST